MVTEALSPSSILLYLFVCQLSQERLKKITLPKKNKNIPSGQLMSSPGQ